MGIYLTYSRESRCPTVSIFWAKLTIWSTSFLKEGKRPAPYFSVLFSSVATFFIRSINSRRLFIRPQIGPNADNSVLDKNWCGSYPKNRFQFGPYIFRFIFLFAYGGLPLISRFAPSFFPLFRRFFVLFVFGQFCWFLYILLICGRESLSGI